MDIKQAALSPADAQPSADQATMMRRRLLGAGVSGAALSLLPWLSDRARAQPSTVPPGTGGDTASTTTEPAPTTTAPPRRPTPADYTLLVFAQSIEVAMADLYDIALGANVFDGSDAEVITTIRAAHQAYAQSISGLLGRDAPGLRNDAFFNASRDDFKGSAAAVALSAAKLENTFVATHIEILDKLVGINGAALIASILVVESRHAMVLYTLAGASALADQLADDGDALSPSDYPVK